ncbi:MAG: phosphoribosylformimino-5-aminoimidazole carboxamide ribotide isomerase [Eubacteriales bacterium]
MEFRPCIDIHNGKVKQIVGSSLQDQNDQAIENYVSTQEASYYAKLYKDNHLKNGHIILLNPPSSPYFVETKKQAINALSAYPNGMQIGGGIHLENASEYIEAGASHVIVTSYLFENGNLEYERLEQLKKKIGKERIVVDLSCRKRENQYYIMTNRWQTYTEEVITYDLLEKLGRNCDEFLIHAVDVEGKANGIEEDLVQYLSAWNHNPITYAGGVRTLDDIKKLKDIGKNMIHITVGSAMDLFGGNLLMSDLIRCVEEPF